MKEKLRQLIAQFKSIPRARMLFGVFFALVFGVTVLGFSDVALAANTVNSNAPSNKVQEQIKGNADLLDSISSPDWWIGLGARFLLYIAQLGIKITLFLFTFVIQISAYNGYLGATAVNVGWVMVRDMTNMLFVIVLLLIAFGTILGLEQYEWKKMLVKFVMAAILVNFSRLICGLLIDISQLIMTTFINGIVATAGGNLINAFGLQKIINLNSAAKPQELTSPGIFSAALMAVVFSLTTVYTIGIFVFILAKRLVTLWILIVLSPMAFVLTILPSTESAASKWWSELIDNLVTGPVILFFIWLSFVTVGQGQINTEISQDAAKQIGTQYVIREGVQLEADSVGGVQAAGVGDAMGWNQMASFIIAFGMLIAGAEVAGQIGGSSGSALSGVAAFGSKVATLASGYAVGRWLYGKGAAGVSAVGEGVKAGAKFLAMDVLPVRHYGQIIANKAKQQWAGYQAAAALTMKEELTGNKIKKKIRDPETGEIKEIEVDEKRWVNIAGEQQFWGNLLKGNVGHALASRTHKRMLAQMESAKILEKTEHEKETRMAIMEKSVKGVPQSWFQHEWEKGKDGRTGGDGFDRRQDAFLDGMGERSSAKTEEHRADAMAAMMQSTRVQYDPGAGKWVEKTGSTYGTEIAGHQIKAAAHNQILQKVQAQAKVDVMLKDQAGSGPYAGQLMALMQKGALAQREAEAAEAKFHAMQGAVNREALTAPEGQAILAERAQAEAEAHTEHNKEEEILKAAEVAFQQTAHGAHELLQDAEIARRMKALEGASGVEKARAETTAAVTEAASIAAEQLARIQEEGLQERVKNIEEESRTGVLKTAEGREAQERLERARISTSVSAEESKAEEASAKAEATRVMQSRIQSKDEAAIQAALSAASQKVVEDEAQLRAKQALLSELKETEKAKIRSSTQEEIIKELEAEVRQSLVADKSGVTSVEYQNFLSAQARSAVIKNTLASSEKVKGNDAQKAMSAKGLTAENKARELETKADLMHSSDPAVVAALNEIRTKSGELSQLGLEISALERNVKAAGTVADKAKAQAALDKKKIENESKEKTIKNAIADLRNKVRDGDAKDTKLASDKAALNAQARELRQKDVMRVYAAAKALEEESNLALSSVQDQLLSDVEQTVVHNTRGVQTPTKALGKTAEVYARDFAGMDYKMFTTNIGSNILAMQKKRDAVAALKGEIVKRQAANPSADVADLEAEIERVGVTTADKAETAALIQHGVSKGWMDDGIWRLMDDDLKDKITTKLGWKNKEFNIGKINDLMAVMTSGGDLDFAESHHAIGKAMDFAEQQLKMSKEDFYEKLEEGTFTTEERAAITSKIGSKDAGIFNNSARVKEYIEKVDENQAQLQLVTNMRDEAAASSHPENGGHGDYVVLKNGKKRYVLNGSQVARAAVYAEVNKLDPSTRARQKSHASMNLDEGSGYATKVREEDSRIVRGNLNSSNDHRGTDVRYENHSGGLSATENSVDYVSDQGFLATGEDKFGNQSGRHSWAQSFSDVDDTTGEKTLLKEEYDLIKASYAGKPANAKINGMTLDEAMLQKTSSDIVNNIFVPRLATNPRDWLISMAKLGQIDENEALKSGKVNLVVRVNGKAHKLKDVNELIDLHNKGAFNGGKTPTRQLANLSFTP